MRIDGSLNPNSGRLGDVSIEKVSEAVENREQPQEISSENFETQNLQVQESLKRQNSVPARVEMRNELTSSMAGSNLGQSGDGSNVVIPREEYYRLMGKIDPATQTLST